MNLNKLHKHAFVASATAGLMIFVMLFIFTVFEQAIEHGIAIASFAATTAIIVFTPTGVSSQPRTIGVSYISAAVIGYIVSLVPLSVTMQAAIAVGVIVALLIYIQRMHPPAVAYAFGFIIGGYGLSELLITFPALLGFFIALATTAFMVERAAVITGIIKEEKEDISSLSVYQKVERVVDKGVPYVLIVLFIAIVIEFVYAEQVEPYYFYFSLIDWIVILFFVVDLTFKFRKMDSTLKFIRVYWLDIIATVPFFIVFRLFQGAAVTLELISRGTVEVTRHMSMFTRFLRPLARFPRFARMLHNLEKINASS